MSETSDKEEPQLLIDHSIYGNSRQTIIRVKSKMLIDGHWSYKVYSAINYDPTLDYRNDPKIFIEILHTLPMVALAALQYVCLSEYTLVYNGDLFILIYTEIFAFSINCV